MTDASPQPTHLLTLDAVRWGNKTLGAQRINPAFLPYLWLRKLDRSGGLPEGSVTARPEFRSLVTLLGNVNKPFYSPLKNRRGSGWLANNIAGIWSPASIARGAPWLTTGSAYVLPDDHVAQARAELLYDEPISALALGSFFLRNDGFVVDGAPAASDVVAAFRDWFDFPATSGNDFTQLFSDTVPSDVDFAWFEPYEPPADPIEGPADV